MSQEQSKHSIKKPSAVAQKTASRLFAVQAVYQALQNDIDPVNLVEEYVTHRVGMDLEDGKMVPPDLSLFKSIMAGVSSRRADLEHIISARLKEERQSLEFLLAAILLCGTYEILAHHDIDAPIIISDYLDVTKGFYAGPEPKLINAVLDAVAKEIRA